MELVICVFLIGFKNILVSYTEGRQVNVRDLPARAQAARSRESRPHLPPARRTWMPRLGTQTPPRPGRSYPSTSVVRASFLEQKV